MTPFRKGLAALGVSGLIVIGGLGGAVAARARDRELDDDDTRRELVGFLGVGILGLSDGTGSRFVR